MRFDHVVGWGKQALGAAAALAVLTFPAPAGADPPVWRIHGPQGEVVLFGSVHVLSPDLMWRTPALGEALAKTDSLWFEVPVDDTARTAAQTAVAELSKLRPGQTLAALLSARGRANLAKVCASLGVPAQALDGLQPWFAELTVTLLALQREGALAGSGVEETLSRAAPDTAVRHAFETPEAQVRMLALAPQREQVASLEETLREFDKDPHEFDRLEHAWAAGDVRYIVREEVEPLRKASPGLYRRLVSDRNRTWVDQIERLLKTPERAFIVVGVGHLVGPDSVPALLRRRGVVVEGP